MLENQDVQHISGAPTQELEEWMEDEHAIEVQAAEERRVLWKRAWKRARTILRFMHIVRSGARGRAAANQARFEEDIIAASDL